MVGELAGWWAVMMAVQMAESLVGMMVVSSADWMVELSEVHWVEHLVATMAGTMAIL